MSKIESVKNVDENSKTNSGKFSASKSGNSFFKIWTECDEKEERGNMGSYSTKIDQVRGQITLLSAKGSLGVFKNFRNYSS